jgi:hypothetical protein
MSRRARRKAPWERSTCWSDVDQGDHESQMELMALMSDSLDDMFRPLTPLEAAMKEARRDILAERRRLAEISKELPVPWCFPLAGWRRTPRPWLPTDRQWFGLSFVLEPQCDTPIGWPNDPPIDLESFGQDG